MLIGNGAHRGDCSSKREETNARLAPPSARNAFWSHPTRPSAPILRRRVWKMRKLFPKAFLVTWIAVGALWAGTLHAQVAGFVQVNLVSDIPGLATITDPQLVNPWGVSHSSTSPFWTSNQGKNTATLYTVTDRTTVTKVNINAPAGFVAIPCAPPAAPCTTA